MKHISTTQVMRCPDGLASAVRGQLLKHVWSCPIAVADRAQLRDDLAWLRAHSHAVYRVRPVAYAERLRLELSGVPPRVVQRIEVMVGRGGPGARVLLHTLDGAVFAVTAEPGGALR